MITDIQKMNEKKNIVTIVMMRDAARKFGIPTVSSGKTALKSLELAYSIIKSLPNTALVTAPISKEAIKKTGSGFLGHTEMLASWSDTSDYVMNVPVQDHDGCSAYDSYPGGRNQQCVNVPIDRIEI